MRNLIIKQASLLHVTFPSPQKKEGGECKFSIVQYWLHLCSNWRCCKNFTKETMPIMLMYVLRDFKFVRGNCSKERQKRVTKF